MRRAKAWLTAWPLAVTLVACAGGGSQEPARAPAPAATAPGSDTATPPSEPSPANAPAAGEAAPPAAAAPSTAPHDEAPSMADEVTADIKRAEHEIEADNCPAACRALGSMERAVVFLCTGNRSQDDADRCDNARHHLRSARHRIRTTCGECPGGPSVEPDAPVPSTR